MPTDFLTILGMLAAVAAVLFLAYWATRWIAARFPGGVGSARQGSQLKLLDQLAVGKDSRLVVAQVGARVFLLGVSPSGVTSLAELSAEDAEKWLRQSPEDKQLPSFREAFLSELKNRKK